MAVSPDGTKLAAASSSLCVFDIATGEVLQRFRGGHSAPVTSLSWSPDSAFVVTASSSERFANVWDARQLDAAGSKSREAVHVISLQHRFETVAYNPLFPAAPSARGASKQRGYHIVTLASDGVARVFAHKAPRQVGARVTAAGTAVGEPEAVVRGAGSSSIIAAVPVHGRELAVAYGTVTKPAFAAVQYVTAQGAVVAETVLDKDASDGGLLMGGAAGAAPMDVSSAAGIAGAVIDAAAATVNGMADARGAEANGRDSGAAEMTLQERLDQLNFSAAIEVEAQEAPAPASAPTAGSSLAGPLSQALRANDSALTDFVLSHSAEDIVYGTVERLPQDVLLPLLDRIVERFHARPGRAVVLAAWIRAVVVCHSAALASIPAVGKRLRALTKMLEVRCRSFDKLVRLQGRLDMVLKQKERRDAVAASPVTYEPAFVLDETATAATTFVDETVNGMGEYDMEASDDDMAGSGVGADDEDAAWVDM